MCLQRSPLLALAASFSLYVPSLLGQTTTDVGSGAPTPSIQASFLNAFYRNGFSNLVALPPLGLVKKLGTTGLVQEFSDAAKTAGLKYALVKANVAAGPIQDLLDVLQMSPAVYAYYTSLGTTAAGYPVNDTTNCLQLVNTPGASCQYQLFDKPAALFVYSTATLSATQFNTAGVYYTKWQALGGISAAGPATSAQQTVTSSFGTTATAQIFDQAQIFSISSGTLNGRLVAVGPAVDSIYLANNGPAGFLGFPTGDETNLPDGSRRQTFEGGSIQYMPGSAPVLRYPVQSITLTPRTTVKLNLGDTTTVAASLFDPRGNPLTDRMIVWSTSNSRVVTVQSSGYTAVVKAVGGGSATVQATSEGKQSALLSIVVSAPCCDLGAGSPTPAIQQAFADAVTRNKLSIRLPVAGTVRRAGSGYVQDVQDASTGAAYLIAVADGSVAGYVLGGALLAKYNDLGGPSGSLGYPVSDATPGGRQLFANQAALAGNPVQLVSGAILAKWAALSYETGPAGSPLSGSMPALSFRATTGQVQAFGSGVMFLAASGPSSGKVYFAGGPVAAAYAQSGGITGNLGFPLGDEYTLSGKRRQDFEGGYIDYTPGDAVALAHPGTRQPIVQATPSSVVAGSGVRLAVGGFDNGSTIRVSITGQPDFVVTAASGAYVWEAVIPSNAKDAIVQIHAVDTKTGASAGGSYTVRASSGVRYQIAKIAGDNQSGQPGAVLPQPLVVLVRDDAGNPAVGMTVTFSASPGASVAPATALTDANGAAQALLRLPPSDGIALATADAGHQLATFSAQAVHSALANFPAMTQTGDDGALLASAAAVLRYYQNSGALPAPNGYADPKILSQFLTGFCAPDAQGGQVCDGFIAATDTARQLVNLWRLGASVGGNLDVSIEKPDLNTVRDFLAQGSPLILELATTSAHYVVATGIASDGSILVMDPNPSIDQTNLSGAFDQVIRLIPHASPSAGFLVTGPVPFTISSSAALCSPPLQLGSIFATRCDGSAEMYQLDVPAPANSQFHLVFTDLGAPANRLDLAGAGAVGFKVLRLGGQWTAAPQDLNFTAASVVNAASFTPDLSPGELFSAFGSGMSAPAGSTSVIIGGSEAAILAQTPFQVNGQVPPSLAPGTYTIKIVSPFGSLEQPITIQPTAPAIFLIGANQAAVINQNGTLNTRANPAGRGETIVVFSTGLGSTSTQGQLHPAVTPVTVFLNGSPLRPSFAGLTPGFIGLYQVNAPLPPSTPPGLALPLQLQQGNASSNIVSVSVQ